MGWRSKILFSLILYCGGFLTAVYVLAPGVAATASLHARADEDGTYEDASALWAVKMRAGIDRFASFAEDKALLAAELIRLKMEQSKKSG